MLKSLLVLATLAAASAALDLLKVRTEPEFGGQCKIFTGDLDTCCELGEYDDLVSSADIFGNDVILHPDADCLGLVLKVTGPARNLNDLNFDNVVFSFYVRDDEVDDD
ncbi:hypothetical protein BGX33_009819 [Mortierella sp. NVP41]|nr:hypothetical protein BGX33_009819 [Mortierella sp. NVP41]